MQLAKNASQSLILEYYRIGGKNRQSKWTSFTALSMIILSNCSIPQLRFQRASRVVEGSNGTGEEMMKSQNAYKLFTIQIMKHSKHATRTEYKALASGC